MELLTHEWRGRSVITFSIFAESKTFVLSIVLDGEMLVWDPVSERNLPFGTLKTAALDKSKKDYNPRPCCESSTCHIFFFSLVPTKYLIST